jgi:stalled ribosome rescue protein Dom34
MISNHHVAVWIDHHEARIFHINAERIDENTVRASTHHVHRDPNGPGTETRHADDAPRFFREIARQLEGAHRVLVVGPSTAKLQFIHYVFKHDPALEPRTIAVETVDPPTDGQLMAHLRRYFDADDRMQGISA